MIIYGSKRYQKIGPYWYNSARTLNTYVVRKRKTTGYIIITGSQFLQAEDFFLRTCLHEAVLNLPHK